MRAITICPNFAASLISLNTMFHPLDHNTLASTVDGGHPETSRLFLSDAVFKRMLSPKENDQTVIGWLVFVCLDKVKTCF